MEDNEQIRIREVTEYANETLEAVRRLAKLEGENFKTLTESDLHEMIESTNVTLFVAEDSVSHEIMGMVTVIICRIPYVKKAVMEDLVVDETFRGRGIGTKLINTVVATAQAKGASYLDFSSRPRREGENNMYEKLGFQRRETNVYRHVFDYGEV